MARPWKPNKPRRFSSTDIVEAAQIVGCSPQTLRAWLKESDFPWIDQSRSEFCMFELCVWKHRAMHPVVNHAAANYDADDDEFLDSLPATDAVEQKERIAWIRERRLIAQQKRMEADQQLCARDVVRDLIVRWGNKVRAAAERIQRRFGPDAAKPLLDAMDELSEELAEEGVVGDSD